jgi:hypothetical protein
MLLQNGCKQRTGLAVGLNSEIGQPKPLLSKDMNLKYILKPGVVRQTELKVINEWNDESILVSQPCNKPLL